MDSQYGCFFLKKKTKIKTTTKKQAFKMKKSFSNWKDTSAAFFFNWNEEYTTVRESFAISKVEFNSVMKSMTSNTI